MGNKRKIKSKKVTSKTITVDEECIPSNNEDTLHSTKKNLMNNLNINTPTDDSDSFNKKFLAELRVIKGIFDHASNSLSQDISYICSLSNNTPNFDDNTSIKLENIKMNLKHNFRNLNLAFSCIQDKYTNVIRENHALNQKINTKSNSLMISEASQTENKILYTDKSTSTNDDLSLKQQAEKTVQTEVFIDQKVNNFQINSISKTDSDSFHRHATVDTKYLKIKIEEVPSIFKTNDIRQEIHNINKDPFSSITFIRRNRLQLINKLNYVFKIPETTAVHLFSNQKIIINSMFFNVKPFIDVIRCFICQQLGHCSNFCGNSITCAVCAEAHSNKDCKKQPLCINCSLNNKSGNTCFNVNHTSYSRHCKSIKLYIEQHRQDLKNSQSKS